MAIPLQVSRPCVGATDQPVDDVAGGEPAFTVTPERAVDDAAPGATVTWS